jgi:hypothetical protein
MLSSARNKYRLVVWIRYTVSVGTVVQIFARISPTTAASARGSSDGDQSSIAA